MEETSAIATNMQIDSLNAKARGMSNNPDPGAQQIAEEALVKAESVNYQKGIAEALCTLSWRNLRTGDYTLMLELAERAIKIASEIRDNSIEARACNNIGLAYASKSDYSMAIEYYMRSLSLQEQIGNKPGMALTLNNIGLVYNETGEYSKAIEHHLQSLALKEETGNKHGIASSLNNIGIVFLNTGEYGKALDYFTRSHGMYTEAGDKQGIADSFNNIGMVYERTNNFNKSLEFYRYSLALNEETGNKGRIAGSLGNIGNICQILGDFSTALEYQIGSLAIKEEIGNQAGIAHSYLNIGELYAAKEYFGQDIPKAIEALATSLLLAEATGSKEIVYNIHRILADIYEQNEDWRNSNVHLKKYYEVEKEVHNEVSSKTIANLEIHRKFAEIEKDREIERRERKAVFKILNRVLPRQIVDRVKSGEENIADKFPSASVLFADIVGFTPLAAKLGADEVVKLLSSIFSHFDGLCERFGVEKIKTIGDSYMAASGVPVECDDHVFKIARLALAMQEDIKLNLDFKIPELSIRIGMHTGEVIAGVLGTQKLSYDIWGDTVNTAARMESTGDRDMIHCTQEVFNALQDKFVFKERGEMKIKGKGTMRTYFLISQI